MLQRVKRVLVLTTAYAGRVVVSQSPEWGERRNSRKGRRRPQGGRIRLLRHPHLGPDRKPGGAEVGRDCIVHAVHVQGFEAPRSKLQGRRIADARGGRVVARGSQAATQGGHVLAWGGRTVAPTAR